MAKTAVVNPRRRRKRRRSSSPTRRRRRRNYGAAALVNPPRRRRRRRRAYGAARRRSRRRNPASPYASTSYYRRPNPSIGSMFNDLFRIIPSATAGVVAARFALKQAGAFEPASDGVLEPGIKHAAAVLIAAEVGGRLLGMFMGSGAGDAARIAALGFGGDLFLRARFMRNSDIVRNHLSLQGMGAEEPLYVDSQGNIFQLNGFQNESALGDTYVDSQGNVFEATAEGWSLQGLGQQFVQTEDGRLYQLNGASSGAVLDGFQNESALGFRPASPSNGSSFGYAPR
jgi:hypothetical protein